MRTLLIAATLVSALLLPVPAAAQDPTEMAWPDATALRRELQTIGYVFARDLIGIGWEVGRLGADQVAVLTEPGDGSWMVGMVLDGVHRDWPDSVASSYTLLAEVLSALPMEPSQRAAVFDKASDEEAFGCFLLMLPGGRVEVIDLEGSPRFVAITTGLGPPNARSCEQWEPIGEQPAP